VGVFYSVSGKEIVKWPLTIDAIEQDLTNFNLKENDNNHNNNSTV